MTTRRRRDDESDDSVLVSSDEEELSSDGGAGGDEEVDDDGYGSLEDELEALAAARAERGTDGDGGETDDDDGGNERNAKNNGDRPPTYDAQALRDALEDVRFPSREADWAEARAVTSARRHDLSRPSADDGAPPLDVDDDLSRELAFYRQALAAARAVAASADAAGVPWCRPRDFYAEMVKSDGHMQRVRAQLEHERSAIEAASAAKQAREAKRFSKEVSAERKREKAAAKKRATEGVAKLRADRARGGFRGELDADAALEALERKGGFNGGGGRDGNNKGKLGQRISRDGPASKKRAFKDAKYGRGGRKRGQRQNDASSAADTRDFRGQGKFTEHFAARKGGGGVKKGGGASKRPGKSRRAAQRSGR